MRIAPVLPRLCLGALALLPALAHAEIARIAGGEVTLNTGLSAEYDSNVGATNTNEGTSESDLVLRAFSTLAYAREFAFVTAGARMNVTAQSFTQGTVEDDIFYTFNFFVEPQVGATFGDERFTIFFDVGFEQSSQIDPEIGRRIDRFTTSGNAGVIYRVSRRFTLTLSGDYTRREPTGGDDENLVTTESYGGELRGSYYFSERLTLRAFTRANRFESDDTDAIDSWVYTVAAGASGTPSEQLSWGFDVGAQLRDRENVDATEDSQEWSPYVRGNLTYQFNPRTFATLSASRNFDVLNDAQNVTRTSVSARLTRLFSEQLTGFLFTSYTLRETETEGEVLAVYTFPSIIPSATINVAELVPASLDREDNSYFFQAGLSYAFAKAGTVSLTAGYRLQESEYTDALPTEAELLADPPEAPLLTEPGASPIAASASRVAPPDFDRYVITLLWSKSW